VSAMEDYSLQNLVDIIKDVEQKEEGIWVRLYNELKVCLMGVQDAPTGKFTAKFFPCAKNSKQYTILYNDIWRVEKESPDAEGPLRYVRTVDYYPKSGS